MIVWLKYILLVVYCVVGMAGWYEYASLAQQRASSVVYDRLSPEMTVSYVRAIVWYHSRGKLQELRSILREEDLTQQERVKTRITNMLQHRTSAYIRELNGINTPIKNLGNWYQDNFDFQNFLNSVFDVVFNNRYSVDGKVQYVTDIMEKYQNMTTQKLIIELKDKESS